MNDKAHWVAVDWGSTNVRAFALAADSRILAQTHASRGIKHTEHSAYRDVLQQLLSALGTQTGRILLAGMVGSRNGWFEVPYAECPASAADLAADARAPEEFAHARIVPGLSCRRASGSGDVMRGEEVQCSGAMELAPDAGSVCLPGTHSKWVRIAGGEIVEFTTFCTGELYDAVRHHTLIGALIPDGQEAGAEPGPGFESGLARAQAEPGLLSALFSVRADTLLGRVLTDQAADYLSGILIGAELREARDAGMLESVLLIADGGLALRYARALAHFEAPVREIDSAQAFVTGAALIARRVRWD